MITTWRASLAPKSSGSLSHLLLFFSFLMWTIFKVFTEFVTVLLLFYVLVFGPQGMWNPSSPTRARDWTRTPALEGRVLTTGPPDKSLLFFSFQVVRRKGREINLEKHNSYQHILNVSNINTTTQLMKFINELEGGHARLPGESLSCGSHWSHSMGTSAASTPSSMKHITVQSQRSATSSTHLYLCAAPRSILKDVANQPTSSHDWSPLQSSPVLNKKGPSP